MAGSGEVRCVAGSQRLLCCSHPVYIEDTSFRSPYHPLIEAFECSFRESDSYPVILIPLLFCYLGWGRVA